MLICSPQGYIEGRESERGERGELSAHPPPGDWEKNSKDR